MSNTVQRKRDTAQPKELRPAETDVENSTTPAIYGFESAKKNNTDKINDI